MIRMVATLLALQGAARQADEPEKWLPPLKTVTLPAGERTVRQALDAIHAQTGFEIDTFNVDDAKPVTLEWKDRPVLQAVDDLCRALGRGTVKVTNQGKPGEEIQLDGQPALPPAAFHWKQFRAEVTAVKLTTKRSLTETTRNASLSIRLSAQPGTRPMEIKSFGLEEAIDSEGWSLLPSNSYRERIPRRGGKDPDFVEWKKDRRRRMSWENKGIQIRPPAPNAKSIERLRGRVAFTFPLREVEGTVPREEVVEGKKIKIGSLEITIRSFQQTKGNVTLKCAVLNPGGDKYSSLFPQFDLLDADGGKLNRGYSGRGGEEYRISYRLRHDRPVAALRYSAYVGRITVVMPVEFRDIPLPRKKD